MDPRDSSSIPPPPPPGATLSYVPVNGPPPSTTFARSSRGRSMSPRRRSSRSPRRHRDNDDRYQRREYYYYERRSPPPPPPPSVPQSPPHYRESRGGYSRYDRYYERDNRYEDQGRYRRYHSSSSASHRPPRSRHPIDRGSEKDRKDSTTLFVGNLPYSFREWDVASMFERYGRLVKVTVPIDAVTSKNKGFSFVEFEDRRDAEDAYDKFHGFSVEGRRLKLDWDIGLSKKDEHRNARRGYHHGHHHRDDELPPVPRPSPPARDRSATRNEYYGRNSPPVMDSRGYRRDSPDMYRR
ncbi:hypothetical protein BJV82DRAFT_620111 [Fennellomyces sp. T-0311]|nr:hypothetical protein BJV82DRAFT_620111 [Fennellomyces sp. T-0311]